MPVSTIAQTISIIPEAGHRGVDVQTEFVNKQEDFQDHLQGTTVGELNNLKTQLNTMIGELNTAVTQVNNNANTATTKAGEASTSANTATTKAGEASTSATSASTSSTKASQWADNNYNVVVEAGKYSAKHWATEAQNIVNNKVDKVTSTDNAIVRFDGATGKVQNSLIGVDDNGNIGSGTQSFNGFGGSGFKNYIINGGFNVWQRKGTASTQYTNDFVADRFHCTTVKDGVAHYPFNSSQASNRANMPTDYLAIVLQDTNANRLVVKQRIEKSYFANKNAGDYFTLSFYMGHNGVASYWNASGSFELRVSAPTVIDTYTSTTLELTHSFGTMQTLPEFGTKYTKTFQLTQNMISYGMEINLSLYVPVGTAVGAFNSTIRFGDIQLEEGSVATPFEQRPIGLELSLCQRYCWKMRSANGIVGSSTAIWRMNAKNPVPMRIAPSIALSANLSVQVGNVSDGVLTALGANYSTSESVEFDAVMSLSTASPGDSVVLLSQNSNYINVTAEL